MFNLEQAISDWRREMAAGGIESPDILDELQSHLCEDIEHRVRTGSQATDAFQDAVRRIGLGGALKREFDKIENEEKKFMKRSLLFIAAFIGIMVGMAFVMPAVAQYQHEGVMRNGEPWLFLLGSLLTLAGCGAAIRGLTKGRA
jgi:hypothetical protein